MGSVMRRMMRGGVVHRRGVMRRLVPAVMVRTAGCGCMMVGGPGVMRCFVAVLCHVIVGRIVKNRTVRNLCVVILILRMIILDRLVVDMFHEGGGCEPHPCHQ